MTDIYKYPSIIIGEFKLIVYNIRDMRGFAVLLDKQGYLVNDSVIINSLP
jgi:hypothetical protein